MTRHGGPRPKRRDDDARGGFRPATLNNPGRPPQSVRLKLGDQFVMLATGVNEVWTLTEIRRDKLVFSSNSGESIRMLR